MRWDESGTIDFLGTLGIDAIGDEARAISSDGQVIAGWGINPQGMVEGWVASTRGQAPSPVPEPGPGLLLLSALAGLMMARRRH